MSSYHKYVFDERKREFLGKFEDMYRQENVEGFDSWCQEKMTGLDKKITLTILEQFNFGCILDIGCGKGSFSHLLKKANNIVWGIDVSETAIRKAKSRYPDIVFKVLDANKIRTLNQRFDLVVAMEILSYIKKWDTLIFNISQITDYFFLALFIPENPIGYVKSIEELNVVVEKHFSIICRIVDQTAQRIFCLCHVK